MKNSEIPAIADVRTELLLSLSRISQFWGFPRAMGALYGALYLAQEPLSLEELADQAGITKGAVSTNVRALDQLGMVHKHLRVGERKDYYSAETDFWKMAKTLLEQRRKAEFDGALRTVGALLDTVTTTPWSDADAATATFYRTRLQTMVTAFRSLDSLVGTLLQLDKFRLGAFKASHKSKKEG
jgi:DNA-binding transcriptional regulator GbsR (MarR family)